MKRGSSTVISKMKPCGIESKLRLYFAVLTCSTDSPFFFMDISNIINSVEQTRLRVP